ncbi:MAG: hypothetical protein VXW87_03760 [Pseudomonadota bacterium]|nr:hypothetical protein [Pseudomonadota bacterium]
MTTPSKGSGGRDIGRDQDSRVPNTPTTPVGDVAVADFGIFAVSTGPVVNQPATPPRQQLVDPVLGGRQNMRRLREQAVAQRRANRAEADSVFQGLHALYDQIVPEKQNTSPENAARRRVFHGALNRYYRAGRISAPIMRAVEDRISRTRGARLSPIVSMRSARSVMADIMNAPSPQQERNEELVRLLARILKKRGSYGARSCSEEFRLGRR